MMELREKIIKTLESIEGYRGLEHERQADAILAIPEIRDALLLMATANRRFGEDQRPADPSLAYYNLQNAHPLANLLKPEDMPPNALP